MRMSVCAPVCVFESERVRAASMYQQEEEDADCETQTLTKENRRVEKG